MGELRVRIGGREVLAYGTVTIGRDPSCAVVCDDHRVSRRHATLRLGQDGWELEDLGSTNGTWCDGQMVASLTVTARVAIRLGSPVDGALLELEPTTGTGSSTVIEHHTPTAPGKLSSINKLVHELGDDDSG